MFELESIDNQRVAVVSIFAAVLIFIAIIAAQVLFYRLEKSDVLKKDAARPRDLAAVQTEQATSLTTYRWVDRDTDTVTLPIKRAMQLEVENLAGVRQ
jgi:hypothetical protein